ncbi:hypothetical protein DRE_00091 [Drechslerella stenobrocha 248]|uniref:Prolyl 4-hydroxylase alpha subunit domain-containing protein n=1 Tax=Drechslerella stenobrocha 248 TaxID=1043628 RepID=W7HX69_9PEZI|nr:hypothetical protein DRE_00091 [Drechslerella stenobrocha 248]
MAALLSNMLGLVTRSDTAEEYTPPPTVELLTEPEELSPEAYLNIEPLFPALHQPEDAVARPVLRRVDFHKNPASKLARYGDLKAYAAVVENAFTLKECNELLRIAEASAGGTWPIARINAGANLEVLDTSYRNSDRIIYDDQPLADRMLARIAPLIEKDIAYLDPEDAGAGKGPLGWKGTAAKRDGHKFRMTRLNERLRYLRYPVSGFFRMHCDGAYTTPDRRESSLFTFHLYLADNTGPVPLEGGSTRFWDRAAHTQPDLPLAMLKKRGLTPPEFYDVAPVPGSVLVFQHAFLVHSGEPITAGVKLTIRTDFMYERIPEEEHELEYRKHLQRNGLLADEIPVDPRDEVAVAAATVDA